MTLEGAKLATLVAECEKLIADKNYKSPECYTILSHMIKQLINIHGYYRFPTDVIERLELDAIIRCYTKIPRFDMQRAVVARASKGYAPDVGRSYHTYVQLIITCSFLTTIASVKSKHIESVPIDILGKGMTNTYVQLGNDITNKTDNTARADTTYELAYLKAEDLDALLDAETVATRKANFNARLDRLEKLNARGKQ